MNASINGWTMQTNQASHSTDHAITFILPTTHTSDHHPSKWRLPIEITYGMEKKNLNHSLTILMLLCVPSKSLVSLRQTLKLSFFKSSTHTAIASWGLLKISWLTATKMVGEVLKRWKLWNVVLDIFTCKGVSDKCKDFNCQS